MTDIDTRVDDYLNDKLQTFADFETLDALLQNVRSQQQLLQKQLADAQNEFSAAHQTSQNRISSIGERAQLFQKEQEDLDRRLLIITQSDTSDDAVEHFRSSMHKLHKLEVARGYIETLQEVEKLSNDSTSKLSSSPDESLSYYARLRALAYSLHPLQAEAEGAAPHLVDHVEATCQTVRAAIREDLAGNLDRIMSKILWPKTGVEIPSGVQGELDTAVGRLLELQKPELEAQDAENETKPPNKGPTVLLPFETLAKPLEKRFQYHFSGDRPTNRLDKPEYFLSHVVDLLNSHASFIQDYLQPILVRRFKGSSIALDPLYIDAISAFITALLPMVRTKLLSLVPQLTDQPQLLSHLIHELISFDNTLRTEWRYAGSRGRGETQWKGLTWEILVIHDWFGRWLQVETEFALARYESIVEGQDSFSLEYDSVDHAATKPTKAAMRVHDLLETITEIYRPLTSFSQKVRFLIDIQLAILDRFHHRLNSSLEAFQTMTSSIGRTVQGVSAADLENLKGVKGLERLCRVFGSADLLEKAMRDWSDDVFFLDLWDELQLRAASERSGAPIIGPLSAADVASRTSSALLSTDDGAGDPDDPLRGALFDETASAYLRLASRAESVIVETVSSSALQALRPYVRGNPFSSLSAPVAGGEAEDAPSASSPDLASAVKGLSASMTFLARALGSLPLRRVRRQVGKAVDGYLFNHLVLGHSFSARGATQLRVDVAAVNAVLGVVMNRCSDGALLMGLEAKDEDSAWNESDGPTEGEPAHSISLWEVERRLFADNESAREVLDALGVEHLSESEARQVLRRRVELAR